MPAEFKLRKELIDGQWRYEKKFALKKLALQRYPPAVIDRPKRGFGIPLGDWFAHHLKEEISRKLLRSRFLADFFQMREVEKIIQSHTPKADKSHQLWNLLFLDEWMRQHEAALPSN